MTRRRRRQTIDKASIHTHTERRVRHNTAESVRQSSPPLPLLRRDQAVKKKATQHADAAHMPTVASAAAMKGGRERRARTLRNVSLNSV